MKSVLGKGGDEHTYTCIGTMTYDLFKLNRGPRLQHWTEVLQLSYPGQYP